MALLSSIRPHLKLLCALLLITVGTAGYAMEEEKPEDNPQTLEEPKEEESSKQSLRSQFTSFIKNHVKAIAVAVVCVYERCAYLSGSQWSLTRLIQQYIQRFFPGKQPEAPQPTTGETGQQSKSEKEEKEEGSDQPTKQEGTVQPPVKEAVGSPTVSITSTGLEQGRDVAEPGQDVQASTPETQSPTISMSDALEGSSVITTRIIKGVYFPEPGKWQLSTNPLTNSMVMNADEQVFMRTDDQGNEHYFVYSPKEARWFAGRKKEEGKNYISETNNYDNTINNELLDRLQGVRFDLGEYIQWDGTTAHHYTLQSKSIPPAEKAQYTTQDNIIPNINFPMPGRYQYPTTYEEVKPLSTVEKVFMCIDDNNQDHYFSYSIESDDWVEWIEKIDDNAKDEDNLPVQEIYVAFHFYPYKINDAVVKSERLLDKLKQVRFNRGEYIYWDGTHGHHIKPDKYTTVSRKKTASPIIEWQTTNHKHSLFSGDDELQLMREKQREKAKKDLLQNTITAEDFQKTTKKLPLITPNLSFETEKSLLNNPRQLFIVNADSETPLVYRLRMANNPESDRFQLALLKAAAKLSQDEQALFINKPDNYGNTALLELMSKLQDDIAMRKGRHPVSAMYPHRLIYLKMILTLGADINYKETDYWSQASSDKSAWEIAKELDDHNILMAFHEYNLIRSVFFPKDGKWQYSIDQTINDKAPNMKVFVHTDDEGYETYFAYNNTTGAWYEYNDQQQFVLLNTLSQRPQILEKIRSLLFDEDQYIEWKYPYAHYMRPWKNIYKKHSAE